jgi:hypothetical protein
MGCRERFEACVLVGVEDLSKKQNNKSYFSLDASLIALRELIWTAGVELKQEVV